MKLAFQKIHGAGNDFVVFDNRQGSVELSDEQVQFICDRHFGVGADGVIEVRKSSREEVAFYMHYRNADGSVAEMCGNGIRCFVCYLVGNGLLSNEELAAQSIIVDTLAGSKPITFKLDEQGMFDRATVAMGEPSFSPESIPTTLAATQSISVDDGTSKTVRMEQVVMQQTVMIGQVAYLVTCVNMGNPHAVIFLEYLDVRTARAFIYHPESVDLEGPGAYLEGKTELFPQKTNVELAATEGGNTIHMRVYERGVGETLACGTGACATAVVAIILGRAVQTLPVKIKMPGGILEVEWLPNNQVTLTGSAKMVFDGILSLD